MSTRAGLRRQDGISVSIGPSGVAVSVNTGDGASGTAVGTDTSTDTATSIGTGTGDGSTSTPPTSVPPTSVPPTSVPPTSAPPTSAPPTSVPPTSVPPTSVPPTSTPPTSTPPTSTPPTSAPPTSTPPTSTPPTSTPPTSTPPTSALPSTTLPSTTLPSSPPPSSDTPPPSSAPPTSSASPTTTDPPPSSSPPPNLDASSDLRTFTLFSTLTDSAGHLTTSAFLSVGTLQPTSASAPASTPIARDAALGGVLGGLLVVLGLLSALFFLRRRALSRRLGAAMRSASRKRRARPLLDDEFDERAAPMLPLAHTAGAPSWSARPGDPFAPHTPPHSAPRLLRARGSETGSVFEEHVWPPPGAGSRLVDPLRAASAVSLHDIVDGVMGHARAGSALSGHTRAHSEAGEDVGLLGGEPVREKPAWLDRKVRASEEGMR